MASYSPISSRSTRNLNHVIKRRDSINSSIGATSVRRLIAVVRNTSSRSGPVYSRRLLIKNLITLCVSHIFITSTFLPFLALQSSVSVWILPLKSFIFPITVNIGSLLLTSLCLLAAVSTLFGPSVIKKLGCNSIFLVSYLTFCLFYAAHIFPILYSLVPAYLVLGLVLGPISIARITFLLTISTKITYGFTEDDEDAKILRRTIVIRRVARAFQAAQDFGLIFGSVLSAILITYTLNSGNEGNSIDETKGIETKPFELNCTFTLHCNADNNSYPNGDENKAVLDDIFDLDEFGERLCGSHACPSNYVFNFNTSQENFIHVLPNTTATLLASVYLVVSFLALLTSGFGLDKIKMYVHQDPLERSEGFAALRGVKESFRDVRLQLAAPLAVFIGLEQAFMYADFSKVKLLSK